MKQWILSLFLLLAIGYWCAPQVMAQEDEPASVAPKKKKKKGKKVAMSPVAAALSEAGYFTESEASPKAKFYLFICSASWCGPCRQLMPQIVEEYETKMKKDKKVSMVLLGCDQDEASARQYIEHYKTDMPGVLFKSVAQVLELPKPSGIPAAIVVNAKGEVLATGHGSILKDWKSLIKKKPAKKK